MVFRAFFVAACVAAASAGGGGEMEPVRPARGRAPRAACRAGTSPPPSPSQDNVLALDATSFAATVGKDVYESGGIVAAVCHGPSALINIKLSDGTYLVQGKTLTAFTNEEEGQVNLPLPGKSCQDALSERGATFVTSPAWSSHVQSSDRVMTGQNPGSAGALGEAIVAAIA
jgi:hypothetical protein